MRKRSLNLALAMGLVASLFVGVFGASAQYNVEEGDVYLNMSSAHFPFVPNGLSTDGEDSWYGSVTIQNLSSAKSIQVVALTNNDFSGDAEEDDAPFTTDLQPNASKTFSADQMGIDAPGSAVTLLAAYSSAIQNLEDGVDEEDEFDFYLAPSFAALMKQASPEPVSSNARTNSSHMTVDGHTAIPGTDIAWGRNSEFCYDLFDIGSEGGMFDADACSGVGGYNFGEGFMWEFEGSSYLPIVQTNSGWNTVIAMSNIDASIQNAGVNLTLIPSEGSTFGSGQIQNTFTINPGETEFLNLADFLADQGIDEDWVGSAWIESDVGIASSALRMKPSDNMLAINTAAPSFASATTPSQIPLQILDDLIQDEGFILLDAGDVGAEDTAELQAVGNGFELYGSLVYKDYNGWNTGISVVNTAEVTNSVSVTFYGPTGNAVQSEHLTLPPRGSNFVYSPASQDANLNPGFVGSVVIGADAPVHATIDQVKYETGEAMSYMAGAAGTASLDHLMTDMSWPGEVIDPTTIQNLLDLIFNEDDDDFDEIDDFEDIFLPSSIGMPLVQKGNVNGVGDTSGIQLFNASSTGNATGYVEFFLSGGSLASPTQNSPIEVNMRPMQTMTLYTQNYSQMPSGFIGSAKVTSPLFCPEESSCSGGIVGVSNNVNYDVGGDGSTAFNMASSFGQYRMPYSQFLWQLITLAEGSNGLIGPIEP